MRSIFILILLTSLPCFAASTVRVQTALSVYSKPDFTSRIVFTLQPGTEIAVSSKAYGGFRKIKGPGGIGYVTASDLHNQNRPPKQKKWGAGAGLTYTRLSQGEKTFETSDDVEYKITGYSGSNVNPVVSAQFGQRKFWRLHLAYKTVDLAGQARTGIAGAQQPEIRVQYKMLAIGAQLGWGLWSDIFYAGVGAEVDKTMSGKVMFGTQDLSNQTEFPDYLGAHIFSGAQIRMGTSLSIFVEGRMGIVTNQEPVLNVMELGASLLYWP